MLSFFPTRFSGLVTADDATKAGMEPVL
jgi:hypothetical protein